MAGPGAIAVVSRGTNGDGAAVRGEGDAVSGEILSGFSIDVSTELLPIAVWIALIDANMAGAGAVAVVVVGTNGDDAPTEETLIPEESPAASPSISGPSCSQLPSELS